MFDCVMPTRHARNGQYFTGFGTVKIRNACYARDVDPIEPGCGCPACVGGYTRAYLRHLDRCNEMLASMLGSLHNLWYYETLMANMRAAITAGTFLHSGILSIWRVVLILRLCLRWLVARGEPMRCRLSWHNCRLITASADA